MSERTSTLHNHTPLFEKMESLKSAVFVPTNLGGGRFSQISTAVDGVNKNGSLWVQHALELSWFVDDAPDTRPAPI